MPSNVLTILVPAMPVDGDIAAEGVFRFCMGESDVPRLECIRVVSSYRESWGEERLLPVASHPRELQRLLP